MELPPPLRDAVDRVLSGVALPELAATAAALSRRYRQECRDGTLHVQSEREALAYLAVRLPATYAAVRASFTAVAEARPNFAPRTALDIGAGPGTALWAAAACWPDLADALLVEASPVFRACADELAARARLPRVTWRIADVAREIIDCEPRDLVTLAYMLGELAPSARPSLLERLWRVTTDTLVIVEPGTPAGWQRILAARRELVERGAYVWSRHVRMRMPVRLRRPTGAISPSASGVARRARHRPTAEGQRSRYAEALSWGWNGG